MTDEKKPLKIEFAPGCFDNFEGTQEELDELIQQIETMFANQTPEELAANSRELSDEDWEELPDDVKAQVVRSYMEEDEDDDLADEFKRKLQ